MQLRWPCRRWNIWRIWAIPGRRRLQTAYRDVLSRQIGNDFAEDVVRDALQAWPYLKGRIVSSGLALYLSLMLMIIWGFWQSILHAQLFFASMKAFTACTLALVSAAFASSGDRSPEFQNCVSACYGDYCKPWTTIPLDLRLTRWTCTDDCKYQCMHMLTDQAVALGQGIQQYHGKWPFWRFLGMQEPASVAFSLWNLWFHLQGARQVRQKVPMNHPFRGYYLTWAYVSVNAWIWSAVFHTRDLPITEKLDYFSAALAILYALYHTVIRMANLYSPPSKPDDDGKRSFLRIGWAALCIVAYLSHVTYLTILPRFDYTYNMAFNIVLGISHNILWLLYSLPVPFFRRFPYATKTYYPRHVYKAGIFVLLTTAATALELFDFPPLGRVLDAHALWHLSTAPITKFWYDFLIEDAQNERWKSSQK